MSYKNILTKEFLLEKEKTQTAIEIAQDVGCHPELIYRYHRKLGIGTKGLGFRQERRIIDFMKLVDKTPGQGPTGDCWIWTGCYGNDGYGRFRYKGEQRANRSAYKLLVGEIPEGMCICHKCDNRACVNPEHLWIGSLADNVKDMFDKNRNKPSPGEQNGQSKLTQENVTFIREHYKPRCSVYGAIALSKRFHVTKTHILQIVSGNRWKQ